MDKHEGEEDCVECSGLGPGPEVILHRVLKLWPEPEATSEIGESGAERSNNSITRFSNVTTSRKRLTASVALLEMFAPIFLDLHA